MPKTGNPALDNVSTVLSTQIENLDWDQHPQVTIARVYDNRSVSLHRIGGYGGDFSLSEDEMRKLIEAYGNAQ